MIVCGRAFWKTGEEEEEKERRWREGGGRDEGNRGEEAEKPASGGEVTRLWGQTEDMNNLSTLLMDRLGEKMKRDGASEKERDGRREGGSGKRGRETESRGRGGIK